MCQMTESMIYKYISSLFVCFLSIEITDDFLKFILPGTIDIGVLISY